MKKGMKYESKTKMPHCAVLYEGAPLAKLPGVVLKVLENGLPDSIQFKNAVKTHECRALGQSTRVLRVAPVGASLGRAERLAG